MKKVKVVMIVLAAAVVIGCGGFFGMKALLSSESKTTKIGFENIGELATQSAYCTQVNVTGLPSLLLRANMCTVMTS